MKRLFVFFAVALALALFTCAPTAIHKDVESSDIEESLSLNTPSNADYEVVIGQGDDIAAVFKNLSKKVQKITFEPGEYVAADTLHLPRTGGMVIIDGNGAKLKLQKMGFYSMPSSQDEAMVFNHTRYLIRNFSSISEGDKGVMLGSSFNSVIENIEFVGQKQTAIDLIFCLMSTIKNVLVTNCYHDGIVLRTAKNVDTKKLEWSGASFNNSQCNHSELRSCRVYNLKECTGTSFKILQSSGVRLVNCISEGWPNERAVYYDALGASTAKFFSIKNFHLEHVPREGALCFRSFGSLVEIDGLFVQMTNEVSPVINIKNNGSYVFRNFPYWPENAWIASSNSPSVVIENCPHSMYKIDKYWTNTEKEGEKIFQGYFKSDKMLRP